MADEPYDNDNSGGDDMNEQDGGGDESEDAGVGRQQSGPQKRVIEKAAPASPYVIMEDIVDKLKLLNYEDVFPPISRSYFALPLRNNPGEQFRTLVEYITWILQDLLRVQGYDAPDQYSDPVATASYLVTELKKVGVVVESPAKLKQAHGDAVCIALDRLLDIAIEKTGIKLKSPSIPASMIFSEDEDVDEDEEIEDNLDNQEESDEEEMYVDLRAHSKSDRGDAEKRNQVIESDVNAQEWKLELEQVAPQLILRLHVDHKDWRTHVESISEQEKTITDLMPDTTEKLTKISEEISKITDRIAKREKMLSEDNSVSALLLSYKKNQEELETITSQYKEYEENISSLSNELSAVSGELEEVKNQSDSLRKKLGDTTPLNNIKDATSKLKQEIRAMDLRCGVLTDSLLQAKIKTTRASSASAQRRKGNSSGVTISDFGFDPFAINNNSSFLDDGYSALD